MSMRDYGCPEHLVIGLDMANTWLLRAVRKLGPSRVRWMDGQPRAAGSNANLTETCWALDGKRATENDLYRAAGIPTTRKTAHY